MSTQQQQQQHASSNGGERILIAAVEGGGTSFVVAVAELSPKLSSSSSSSSSSPPTPSPSSFQPPTVLHRLEIDSGHDRPQATINECASFFRTHKPPGGYHALGVATFGPVGLNPDLPSYGRILPTSPKQAWRNIDFLTPLVKACEGPSRSLIVKVDTDVNAPAVAEFMAATSLSSSSSSSSTTMPSNVISSVAYVTVGTGVGVGLVIHGQPVHGRMHPEGGHVPIQPLANDIYNGYSWGDKAPFRGKHTVESMASSVALTERWQQQLFKKAPQSGKAEAAAAGPSQSSSSMARNVLADIDDDDHELWYHAANALACLCVTLILTTSIEKIVLGGGIMKRKSLIEKVRRQTVVLMNGYVDLPPPESDAMKDLIATSSYGSDIGLIGAMVLAQRAYQDTIVQQQTGQEGEEKDDEANKKYTVAFYVGAVHGVVVGAAFAVLGWMAFTAANGKRQKLLVPS